MSQPLGKTIQIFLPDGNPRGVKIAEFTSRTVKAILVPRAQLDFACERPELEAVGLYFLAGESSVSPPLGLRPLPEGSGTRRDSQHRPELPGASKKLADRK